MKKEKKEIISLWLREYRKNESLSQEETARKFKTSLSTYRNWETGRFAPSPAYLSKIERLIKSRLV
jgi:DNA-binding transcriptional regulator YiaG|tara:strand:+ start:442 stop:639 length:198 start_codon:yes stop_codon:yes gene_type:complete